LAQVDNSSLTGESEPQNRYCEPSDAKIAREANNLAFFGTLLVKGQGKAVVINTGDNTFMGRIAKLADTTENVETPLAKEINAFVIKVMVVDVASFRLSCIFVSNERGLYLSCFAAPWFSQIPRSLAAWQLQLSFGSQLYMTRLATATTQVAVLFSDR
jgi:magnesium-transporting ATPase (P-type)